MFFFKRKGITRGAFAITAICAVFLFTAPAIWSVSPIICGVNQADPVAVPSFSINYAPDKKTGMFDIQSQAVPQTLSAYKKDIISYMIRNSNGSAYFCAVEDAVTAEDIILNTGMPVITIGGYTGNDPILSEKTFENMIDKNKVKYFLFNTAAVDVKGQAAILDWIINNGRLIPPEEIEGNNTSNIDETGYILYAL